MNPADFSRMLQRVALAGAHVFGWIFIFQYFYVEELDTSVAIGSTVLTYALTQVIAVLLTPWSGRRVRKGIRRAMILASISAALAFAILGLAFGGILGSMSWGILFFAILMGTYRALYWIPYEVQRESVNTPTRELLLAFIPAVSGILLVSGLPVALLLYSAACLFALSIFPTRQTEEKHEGYSWGYRESFSELFAEENRAGLFASVCDGIEGAALLLIWPVAVFLILDWSYGLLGIVLTVTLLSTIVVRTILHRLNLSIMPPFVVAALAGSAWIMRLLVASPLGVVLVDTYFHAGKRRQKEIDITAHEQAAENTTYVDEYTALKEMGMGIGRILLCIVVAITASSGSFAAAVVTAFIVAGGAAIASVLLARPQRVGL